MAKLHSIPRHRRLPSFQGRVMVDVVRGVLRVRKWPRKRGTPTHPTTLWWNDWFRQANFLAKYADAMSMRRAIEMTAGSPLYPRDVLLSAMRGRLYSWVDDTGWKWYSVAAIGDISESLDVLAQTVGDVLVRAADRWRSAGPSVAGEVLTSQGPALPPTWAPSGGAGGVPQVELAGTPVVPDGSVSFYDFAVTGYAQVEFVLDGVGFVASDVTRWRLSVDGGVTFKSGASDYWNFFLTPVTDTSSYTDKWGFSPAASSANHNAIALITNLRAGRASMRADAGTAAAVAGSRAGFARFDGPVTHIRLFSNSGNNFNAGTIRAVGLIAA